MYEFMCFYRLLLKKIVHCHFRDTNSPPYTTRMAMIRFWADFVMAQVVSLFIIFRAYVSVCEFYAFLSHVVRTVDLGGRIYGRYVK